MEISTIATLSTVRLECSNLATGLQSVGTGYLYTFDVDGQVIPAIVTNKHVISGATTLTSVFRLIRQGAGIRPDGSTDEENEFVWRHSNLQSIVLTHSDDIDLAIILVGPLLNQLAHAPRMGN